VIADLTDRTVTKRSQISAIGLLREDRRFERPGGYQEIAGDQIGRERRKSRRILETGSLPGNHGFQNGCEDFAIGKVR